MDDWVKRSQEWLNSTYGDVPGYVAAPTTGLTGWSTMYSMIRALQHELGITILADNFGDQTMAALTSQIGAVTSETANSNVIGILQSAFWCKGYWGGFPFGEWNIDVSASTEQVRSDIGISAAESIPPKVFKSLLSMDAYVRIRNGTDENRQVQRWLNGRYLDRSDFAVVPCDGIFSRQVQKGLMLAIQYEIGMADGVANGNFGPGTRQGLRDHGIFGLGATDGSRMMVSLYQAALRFNDYGDTPFTGTFDSSTQAQTSAFQSFVELPDSGEATYATWASLLVSTGDVSRPATACDTSTPLNGTTAAQVYSSGYRIVGRYINGTTKRLKHDEAATVWSAGLSLVPIYQEFNDSAADFNYEKGWVQGQRIAIRMRQMGVESDSCVYLAVDFDAQEGDIYGVVIPHFQGVKRALNLSQSVTYKLGVYGTRNVCLKLSGESLTESSYVSDMSTGYSGNLGFRLPSNWAYDQIHNLTVGSGSSAIEIDKVVASSTRARSLTSDNIKRTPKRYTNGAAVGFDEDFYWRFAALGYLVEATATTSLISQNTLNEILLTRIQKPTYWSGDPENEFGWAWATVFTPPIEQRVLAPIEVTKAIIETSENFEPVVGSELYPLPLDGRFGDTAHFAASTRGYTAWGVPEGDATVDNGDLGAWALDLVTAWNVYETERVDAGGTLDVRTWFASNVGVVDSSKFGPGDLRADMAAFLCAKRMGASRDRAVDDIIREMLVAIEDDPGWLARQFVSERFGSRGAMVGAAQDAFTASWMTGFARRLFLNVRPPGADGGTLTPPAVVRDAELEDLANGFADAVENAMLWTQR